MKTIAIWNRYGELFRDGRCFTHSEAPIGDGLLKPYAALKAEAAKRGILVDTLDRLWAQCSAGGVDGVIFFDYPAKQDEPPLKKLFAAQIPLYLVTWENEIIVPENFDPAIHGFFEKVFTWHALWGHNAMPGRRRYVPIRVPQNFDGLAESTEPRQFACLVASSKTSPRPDPRELYTERINTLQWFTFRAPGLFDLYGPGWDGAEMWKGEIPPGKKRSVMSLYDLAIVYENAQGIPGYITEKVFDAMAAGCIPIYWGAPDVHDYLPSGTFIDRRQFVSHESMFGYLRGLGEDEKAKMRSNIRAFLSNPQLIEPWSIASFVDTILKEVT